MSLFQLLGAVTKCWLALSLAVLSALAQQDQIPANSITNRRVGSDQKTVINEVIYQAIGFGNTFLVTTGAGNVVIDTSMPFNAMRHKQLLQAESNAPIRYIILTPGHGDHTGGVSAWKQAGTQIIAQKNHGEFQHYMARLGGFYARNNAAQFAAAIPPPPGKGTTARSLSRRSFLMTSMNLSWVV